MLFYCDDTAALQQTRAEEWLPLLPDWRGRQALGYRNVPDQNLCAAAYLLLRYACAQNGLYELPEFQYGENGKPFFSPKGERLQFNLSHCCEGIACGIAKTAIGVDMQELVDDYEALWDMVCSAGEKRWIRCSDEPVRAFTKLWAMKCYSGGKLLSAADSPFGKALSTSQCVQYCLDWPAVISCVAGVKDMTELQASMAQVIAIQKVTKERIGIALSTVLSISELGTGIGPFLLGGLVGICGFQWMYVLAGVIVIFCGAAYAFCSVKKYV